MAEAVVLGLASDAAMAMGQLLKDRAIDEMKLAWGLKEELATLRDKFKDIQPFLKDVASLKQPESREVVKEWLKNVKDTAYFADDVMDSYDYEMLRRKCEQKKQFMKQFRAFFTRRNPVIFRFRMSHKVSEAIAMFDKLNAGAKHIGLKQVDITKGGHAETSASNIGNTVDLSQARKFAGRDATEFVGREEEMAELLKIMCNPSSQAVNLSTIAIVGQGGLGKTTFARQLYDCEKVQAHFEKKLWVSVPESFDLTKILNDMVECVVSSKSNSPIDTSIQTLQKNLTKKKYLLVLDDVWCTKQELWNNLKSELKKIKGRPGSLVLVTTRNFDVARSSQASYIHSLRGLSPGDGWSLLRKKVFTDKIPPNASILQEIGTRIVEKCKGVPLAIKAIGGILQPKKLPLEWESIENSEVWDLSDDNQVLPSLRLTYDHLPYPSLKQCFAYCAVFPKGSVFEKDELVDIWLAQGFLHEDKKGNMSMEEISEEYETILQNYSLLEETEDGDMFMMHDLVHDLAMNVSGEDVLLWKQKDHSKIDKCRHLVIGEEEVDELSKLDIPMTLSKLRTLSGGLPPNVLAQAKYLRTLTVDCQGIEEVPPSIGLLKHLRYLSLSYNPFSTLPDSIGKLYLLQTLRLLNCWNLSALPPVLYRLVNLTHLPTSDDMNASKGLNKLTNLQTLPHLALAAADDDEGGWSIDELGSLEKLRGEIHISGLELVKSKEKAKQAKFSEKTKISKITLVWADEREETDDGSYDVDVLDALQPHPNITSLELENFSGPMFPSWMVKMVVPLEGGVSESLLKNLTSFNLVNCSKCQTLPTLGYLPCLKNLTLSGLKVDIIGDEFYGVPLNQSSGNASPVSFPSLIELEISDFALLKTWALPSSEIATTVFPLLEVITLQDCPELETMPAFDFQSLKTLRLYSLGIQAFDVMKHKSSFMSSPTSNLKLEILDVYKCPKLVSLPSELQYVTSLKTIEVTVCPALTSLPNDIFHGLTSLRELTISDCAALNNIPTSLEKCTSLETLTVLDCPSIESHAPNFSKLQGVQELCKYGNSMTLMISMLKAVHHLPRLTKLTTGKFKNEVEQKMYFSHMSPNPHNQSITSLTLQGDPNVKSLPEQLQHLAGLKVLVLLEFKAVEELPEWMGCLSSLEELYLRECDALKSLPSKEALLKLTKLRKLEIEDCPILATNCDKDSGSEWSKISRIQHIEIDYEEINSNSS